MMKSVLMIVEAALLALHACSLCNAEEPASLAPLYDAVAPRVSAAQEPASLAPLYEALDAAELAAAEAESCPCDGKGDCVCGDDCDCKAKFTRMVSKPGRGESLGDTMARMENLLARIEQERPLPADDPPPRPETKEPQSSVTRRTQWQIVTVPGLRDGTPEIETALVPRGWEFSASPNAHLRRRCVAEEPGVIAELRAEKLPAYILTYDGKEVERKTGEFPGWQYISKRWIEVSTGQKSKPPQSASADYPLRGSLWTHPGNGKAGLINHLMTGQHAGKFSRSYLESLDLAELESLHSDDHEGRVKTTTTSSVAIIRREPVFYQQNCPNGRCPR
jgi:hypothetical protein